MAAYIQNRGFLISFIFTAFLLVTSFVPLPQIVLLELIYFYEPLTSFTALNLMSTYFVINTILSLAILLLFYFTNGTLWAIFNNVLALIFLYPALVYAFHNLSIPVMPLLSAAIVYGTLLLGLSAIKMDTHPPETE